MRLHANAALSLTTAAADGAAGRRAGLVDRGGRGRVQHQSSRTCSKWVARYREAAEAGLLDRSSAPELVANRTPERRIEAIAALRRLRLTGPEIAELLDMPRLDGVGHPDPDRDGQARLDGSVRCSV